MRGLVKFSLPAVIWATAASVFLGNWVYWFDPGGDFGRELYVPWRLVSGQHLYRDFYYMYGPLSPYLHALLFKLFGVSIHTLVMFNGAVFLGVLAALYSLISSISNRMTAFVSCGVTIGAFGFNQFLSLGTFNFITPYSHEATHGIFLSLCLFLAFTQYLETKRPAFLSLAGVIAGLLFLGKMEIFLAAMLPFLVGMSRCDRRGWTFFLAPMFLVISAAVALLSLAMAPAVAFQGVFGSWALLWNPRLLGSPFQRAVFGTSDLGTNLSYIAKYTLLMFCYFAFLCGLDRYLSRARFSVWRYPLLGVQALLLAYFSHAIPWRLMACILTPVTVVVTGILFYRQIFSIGPRHKRPPILPLMFSMFSLLMLTRVFFRPNFAHYGFFMVMPAAILVIIGLCDWLPSEMKRSWSGGRWFLGAVLVSLGAFTLGIFSAGQKYYLQRTAPISLRGEVFYLFPVDAEILAKALKRIEAEVPPGGTLTVIPSGEAFNFLTRTVNPIFHESLLPPAMSVYGEDVLLAEFVQASPDYVFMVSQDTSEYGYRYFGRDYAQSIAGWISGHYRAAWKFGAVPFQGPEFGMWLLKKQG